MDALSFDITVRGSGFNVVAVLQEMVISEVEIYSYVQFISSNFFVVLFHYDGIVDEWRDFAWSDSVMHVSGGNQTKWWVAKRFLHPDIVAEYNYIFLWDEDLGVDNFHPGKEGIYLLLKMKALRYYSQLLILSSQGCII